jgi:sugar lactone lactonase YvrE
MKTIKRLLLIAGLMIGIVLLYLLLWPVPITPQTWNPPAAPTLTGPYQRNSALAATEKIYFGEGFAPEDVAIDAQSRIYAGMDDGRIVRVKIEGGQPEVFANTNGRPLGLMFDAHENLIVTDAIKGLLSISKDGTLTVLSTAADGIAFKCANDLDVTANGIIYFTDASHKFPLTNYKADLVCHMTRTRAPRAPS